MAKGNYSKFLLMLLVSIGIMYGVMESMIPHHSPATMVNRQPNLTAPEVKELARQIIESQGKQIAQMKKILQRMK
jgi:uncharacterized protein (DUF305 family)